MKGKWIPYLAVVFLLGLLALLATLQYRWLGQISDAESVRLSKRLDDDTKRFAGDFNQEIQKAFFALQVDSNELETGDYRGLKKRYAFWKQESPYPELIKSIYYVSGKDSETIKKFDAVKAAFSDTVLPAGSSKTKEFVETGGDSIKVIGFDLVMPLFAKSNDTQKIIVRRRSAEREEVVSEENIGGSPVRNGYLIIALDSEVIKKQLVPELVKKYFSNDEAGLFRLSITDESGGSIYTSGDKVFKDGDASVRFFALTPGEFNFFSRDFGNSKIPEKSGNKSAIVFRETFTKHSVKDTDGKTLNVDIRGPKENGPTISVFEDDKVSAGGQWVLNVRHSDGSLEKFITNTRNRNLAISFGILSILAAGMILIVIFTQRARALARRQLEFVSSVSHEFRTPLAVIYSAGENISDGVVGDPEKLATYGELIKREGSKLSAMVEQVLEYAGANSGGRTYEFAETRISEVIAAAVEECALLIKEKDFEIVLDIDPGLPSVQADEGALIQAVQNLVANGLKYCNGERWIKISAQNNGTGIQISVEDKGIGISPTDQKSVFEPFYRSKDVVNEQISGNGLGLSLVREIVSAHKGSITVKSEVGRGSTFTIHLPLQN